MSARDRAGERRDAATAAAKVPDGDAGAAGDSTGEHPEAAVPGTSTELERLVGWIDARTGMAAGLARVLHKVFPDHWSFLLGELALFCFLVLLATGTFMALFYTPETALAPYSGAYAPLQGTLVSGAFASVMKLSFDVAPGLLVRQVHHWTALLFVASIATHLARVFFTAAFRRPRELNWLIGVGLLLLALLEGLSGYSLPDDLLSGSGIRIFYSILLSVPFAGPWLANLLFGGPFPGPDILNRLFVLHILLVPAILAAGIGLHVGLVFLQEHSQYRRGAAREDNVVGLPFWPQQAFRSTGLLLATVAVVGLLGGLVEINPIWMYGPFEAWTATVPAQPDWYLGWLEGLLRMAPSVEPTVLGVTIPEPFVPGLVLPFVAVVLLFLWPWIDARITGDHAPHNLLDPWWAQPFRTAAGAGFIALFLVCTVAGANDVVAAVLVIPVGRVTAVLVAAALVLPPAAAIVAWFLARQRRASEGASGTGIAAHRPSASIVVRTATGGFEEVER